jgi:ABC-type branched-subunit amino acid transport system substrate-binding protein
MLNDQGGIQGRKIDISFTDDAYTPQGGVQAAQQCKANQAFVMGGGVGFDTVPAVRAFAEQNDMLYLSSFATEADISRYQRSFSAVLSVERFGQIIGEFAAAKFPGAKVGVVWRNSPNWQGGRDRFLATARERGLQIVADIPVEKDQGDYTNAILRLRDAGAQVVFGWINVLEFTQFEVQARVQDLTPTWLVAGANLLTDTLGHDVDGTKGSQAYGFWPGAVYPPEPGASYQAEIDRMLAAYHKYRPAKDGKVGETEWQFWLASRQLHGLLDLCGRDCSRNKLAGILLDLGPTKADPLCPIDFRRGGGHLGGFALDVWKAVPDGDGSRWTTEAHCAEGF